MSQDQGAGIGGKPRGWAPKINTNNEAVSASDIATMKRMRAQNKNQASQAQASALGNGMTGFQRFGQPGFGKRPLDWGSQLLFGGLEAGRQALPGIMQQFGGAMDENTRRAVLALGWKQDADGNWINPALGEMPQKSLDNTQPGRWLGASDNRGRAAPVITGYERMMGRKPEPMPDTMPPGYYASQGPAAIRGRLNELEQLNTARSAMGLPLLNYYGDELINIDPINGAFGDLTASAVEPEPPVDGGGGGGWWWPSGGSYSSGGSYNPYSNWYNTLLSWKW